MKGQAFRERLLDSTRGQILTLLRESTRTVNELAEALKLTDNAVRAHLLSLERDGLVERQGTQPGTRKPHAAYGLTADAEQIFPKAYGAVFSRFLEAVSAHLSGPELDASLREVGRKVAAELRPTQPGRTRAQRMATALAVLKDLGGAAVLEEKDGRPFIRGNDCPLSAVTAQHPNACAIAEALLTEIIGAPVKEQCVHGTRPRCCFEIAEPAA